MTLVGEQKAMREEQHCELDDTEKKMTWITNENKETIVWKFLVKHKKNIKAIRQNVHLM